MVIVRRQRRAITALKMIRGLLLLGCPVMLYCGWRAAPPPPGLGTAHAQRAPVQEQSIQPPMHELAWYAPLWQRDLKQPPIPPIEPPTLRPPAPPKSLPTLLATCVHGDTHLAHVRERSGRVVMRSVDDVVDGYRLAIVEVGRIQFDDGTDHHWVSLPKRSGP